MSTAPVVACPECDLLQHEVALPPGGNACCGRCGAVLYRNVPDSVNRSLALVLAALVLLVVSNMVPIAGLDLRATHTQTTLIGAAGALYAQGMPAVAVLVFSTTVLVPALELLALCYLLLPLRLGWTPRYFALAFRLASASRHWVLVDVFMLGVLVSLIKLGSLANVLPGVALWSLAGLILTQVALGASFDARAIWQQAAAQRHGPARVRITQGVAQ